MKEKIGANEMQIGANAKRLIICLNKEGKYFNMDESIKKKINNIHNEHFLEKLTFLK